MTLRSGAPLSGEVTTEVPIALRPARATVEDGRVFAVLLDQAQEGMFRMMLGRRSVDILAEAFVHPGHDLSYEYVTFAVQDGRIVGMACAYTAEAHRQSTGEAVVAAAGWHRYRLAVCERGARRVVRFINHVPDGDFYLRALAVDPAHRSAGIGTSLIGAVEDAGRAAGCHRLALDVAAKNRGGRRLYERLGMAAEAESRKWFGLPNTNLIRMAKSL